MPRHVPHWRAGWRGDIAEIPQEEIYLGEIPILMGGGEFIINGAERVIVNQLHRSPGVDFSIASAEADLAYCTRPASSPSEARGSSWRSPSRDVLQMRIDQSTKIPATTFLRAIDENYSDLREDHSGTFYEVVKTEVTKLKPENVAAAAIVDKESGEELVRRRGGCHRRSHRKDPQVQPQDRRGRLVDVGDEMILNTIAEEQLRRRQLERHGA